MYIDCASNIYHEIFNFEHFSRQTKNDSQTLKEAFLATACFGDERLPLELFFHKVEIFFVSFFTPLFASKIECFRHLKKGTFKF